MATDDMATEDMKDIEEQPAAGPATPGDAQGVPVPHEDALPGSSEEYPAVQGVYTFPQTAAEQETDELPAAGDHRDLSK
jgi:hypothetical protein